MTWRDCDGWFDFEALYDEQVAAARNGAVFVEVGVYQGKSLIYLADAVRRADKHLAVVGVDNFIASPRSKLDANLLACGVMDRVTVIESDSAEAASVFAPASVDFCFIDADHSYEAVKRDIAAWRPKMKPGAVMAGHDRGLDGVYRAVVEAFGHYNTSGPCSWWVII